MESYREILVIDWRHSHAIISNLLKAKQSNLAHKCVVSVSSKLIKIIPPFQQLHNNHALSAVYILLGMKWSVYLLINVGKFGEHICVQFLLFLMRFFDHFLTDCYLIHGSFVLRFNFENLKQKPQNFVFVAVSSQLTLKVTLRKSARAVSVSPDFRQDVPRRYNAFTFLESISRTVLHWNLVVLALTS